MDNRGHYTGNINRDFEFEETLSCTVGGATTHTTFKVSLPMKGSMLYRNLSGTNPPVSTTASTTVTSDWNFAASP